MTNVKKVDCALLPPCAKTVHNKLRRAHFISILWGNADSPHPGHDLDPLNYGWVNNDGYYTPDWFSGHAVPAGIFQEDEGEDNSVEDDQADAAIEFDDVDESEALSDDSESEAET